MPSDKALKCTSPFIIAIASGKIPHVKITY